MANFTITQQMYVWNKGLLVEGFDKQTYRKDVAGAWIKSSEYGNTNHSEGWEIDHIVPVARGGSDDLSNLQPLNWRNNRYKGDKLMFECKSWPVKANGYTNIILG